MKRSYMTKII